jgi:hypothetical protein
VTSCFLGSRQNALGRDIPTPRPLFNLPVFPPYHFLQYQAGHASSAASPRRPLAARSSLAADTTGLRPAAIYNAGGPDSIKFGDGSDDVVYTCGVKEAQMQLALNPELRKEAEAQGPAGGRVPPQELGVRRRRGNDEDGQQRRPLYNAGGPDSMHTVWADPVGPAAYKESVSEAQARLAHDPTVRQDAERIEMAGRRVEAKWLGESIRTTRPIGGHSSFALGWNERGAANSNQEGGSSHRGASVHEGAPFATDLSEKARILRPEHTVGGRSGVYLEGASVKDNGTMVPGVAAGQRPGTASGPSHTRGYQNSSGVGGIFGGGNDSWATGGDSSMGTPGGSRLRKEQPLGGRGLSGVNLEEVGAKRPGTAGGRTLAHQQSSIIF